MRLVVDSNVLFTYFWENSLFHSICTLPNLLLFSPRYALTEILKYRYDIMKKSNIAKKEFEKKINELQELVAFIPEKEYKKELQKIAKKIKSKLKEYQEEMLDDIDFLALSQFLQCSIWSNDKILKKQGFSTVLDTEEIVKILTPTEN